MTFPHNTSLDSDLAAQRALNRMLRRWGYELNDDQYWELMHPQCPPYWKEELVMSDRWDNRLRSVS